MRGRHPFVGRSDVRSLDALPFDEYTLHGRYPGLREFREELGNTPLVGLPGPQNAARVFAKCEWTNPTGSIKDRTAYAMVCDMLSAREFEPGKTEFVEYSGGNLAASLSELLKRCGIRFTVVLSSSASASLRERLRRDGSELILVDKERGFLDVIEEAIKISRERPHHQLMFQHLSRANVTYHRLVTGPELLRNLNAVPAAWVAACGTGGTLVGIMQCLREFRPGLRTIGVTPAELPYGTYDPPNGCPKLAGTGGIGYGARQPIVRAMDHLIERHEPVPYLTALASMKYLEREAGIRTGSSGGANWLTAYRVAMALPPSEVVATVLPCAGTAEERRLADREAGSLKVHEYSSIGVEVTGGNTRTISAALPVRNMSLKRSRRG
ncbi:MAG: pyridoxal-phosphate dependent enzyme [Acidobacteriota bacterium]|nr:pyridoxal-phosphate dependent enzyme [Acidobacteriota bacterium]